MVVKPTWPSLPARCMLGEGPAPPSGMGRLPARMLVSSLALVGMEPFVANAGVP